LYWKQAPSRPVKAGLLAVKDLSDGIRFINEGEVISPEQFTDFENHLIGLIGEITNPGKAFYQTEDERRCQYCPYKEICHR
jgi:MoaA/NifB/PqqE/SkfB family radical SAM enzyme